MPDINYTPYVNNVAPTIIVPVNATAVTMGTIEQFKSNTSTVASYTLRAIANAVTINNASPTVVWQAAIPAAALGLNVIMSVFFNLYNASAQFTVGQTFSYGVYIDGVPLSIDISTTTVPYTQTTASNYALSTGGVLLGTNGILGLMPIMITATIPATATNFQISITSSSAAMATNTMQIGASVVFTYYTKNF
jgi:hypothetical protein